MKIEKLNDHQIRCTLTSEDLATRNIKLSELAYGSEKAKALFRDMMQQAAMDFGFEAEDIPIMIEAIPLSSEKIVLIISKVESPDELDTRFSNFTQADTDNENEDDDILSFGSDAFGDSSDQEPDETSMQLLDLLQQRRKILLPSRLILSDCLLSMNWMQLSLQLTHCRDFIREKTHCIKILRPETIILSFIRVSIPSLNSIRCTI